MKETVGYADLGTVFIHEACEILKFYQKDGISSEAIETFKYHMFYQIILTYCALIKKKVVVWQSKRVLYWYDIYYKDVPYYEEGRKQLIELVQPDDGRDNEMLDDKGNDLLPT